MSEKLQKVLARAGLGSRRQLEQWIVEGRIKVNGKLAKLGDRVDEFAEIRVDNFPLQKHALQEKKTRVILYHKPEGELTTRSDPEGRPTVFDHLPLVRNARWIAIGRLDLNTSGVLLFTTDGELANQLMHPSSEIEREYAVRIYGEVTDLMIKNLKKGVELEDGLAKFQDVKFVGGEGKNRWYHVIICEGRNREVRRLWESQEGIKVSRLIRVRFGHITLPPTLRPGKWMELELAEIENLTKKTAVPVNKNRAANESERVKPFSKNSRPELQRKMNDDGRLNKNRAASGSERVKSFSKNSRPELQRKMNDDSRLNRNRVISGSVRIKSFSKNSRSERKMNDDGRLNKNRAASSSERVKSFSKNSRPELQRKMNDDSRLNRNRAASGSERVKPFSKNSRPILKRNLKRNSRSL